MRIVLKRINYIMEPKRLYRSTQNKVLAGVCGGIAEYFNIDPVIVRLIAVVLSLPGLVTGLIVYIIAAIIIPKAPATNNVDKV